MTRHAPSEQLAKLAAHRIENLVGGKKPGIGVVLGTGWGDTLTLEEEREISLTELPEFKELGRLEGHARKIAFGNIGGKSVVALRGRVHLNEAPCDANIHRMVRLQVETLFHLGVKTLILTAAVGNLDPRNSVGDVVSIDSFITLFAPEMPLFAGEFCSPEDTLKDELHAIVQKSCNNGSPPFSARRSHVMLRGPFFEGRKKDKELLARCGADVVGMSILPEACIAALYDIPVLALGFVTNTAYEEHSHETNQARAKESASKLGSFLARIITNLP